MGEECVPLSLGEEGVEVGVAEPQVCDQELGVQESSTPSNVFGASKQIVSLTSVCASYLPAGHPCADFLKNIGFELSEKGESNPVENSGYPLKGKRWYVKVTVLGETGEFLVDTGASNSVISKRFFEKLPCDHSNLSRSGKACTADGSPLRTFGRVMLRIKVREKEFVSTPTIAEISDDGILGLDFASLYGAVLDPRRGMLRIEHPYGMDEQCVLRQISCVASVVDTVKVPPGQTCDVLITGDSKLRGKEAVFEPDEIYLASIGLESVDTLIGSASWSVLPVINRGMNTVYLPKGSVIGEVCLINATVEFEPRKGSANSLTELLDEELTALVTKSDLVEPEDIQRLKELLSRHTKAFGLKDEVGRTDKVQHGINTGDAQPFKIPYRRLPLAKKALAEGEIVKQLKQGVIVPSSSPWSSPVNMTTKKDGTIRFCIDYRKLNGLTKKNSYPLPRIDETLDSLGGNAWFCTLDLQSGYWQIGMNPDDIEKTAFSSHMGLFEYNVMPFGLCNAPATFEAMMETLLADLLWKKCLVYLDDVIVFGKTFHECAENLEEIIKRIHANGLKLKPKKCNFFKKSIVYLGRVISTTGVKADPEKLKAVEEWETPKNPKDVRSFLGFCSYYRDFIPGYARVRVSDAGVSTLDTWEKRRPVPLG